jgi:hypothetical protein
MACFLTVIATPVINGWYVNWIGVRSHVYVFSSFWIDGVSQGKGAQSSTEVVDVYTLCVFKTNEIIMPNWHGHKYCSVMTVSW